jgi:hypothetical protein
MALQASTEPTASTLEGVTHEVSTGIPGTPMESTATLRVIVSPKPEIHP